MPISSLVTAAGVWLWDKYGKAVTDKAAGTVKERLSEFKWQGAAEKYRAKIKKLYGTMQIMGMAKPVSLDDIFTDAYMLDKPTAFCRFDIERLKQTAADPDAPPNAERINGLRLVREKGNLFILGKPGAGKTTFLKYIALQAAEQNIDKIPIFISLKEWADSGAELMPFIAERFDICDFPEARPFVEELLKSSSAIVLFDGLDEVNQESGQRDKQTRAMNNFVEKYDQTQCLITCRVAASDYSFHPFTYVEIADFTENQIKIFVGNWFRNQEGEKDEETRNKFLSEFARDDNKGLRDLARTPLLLTLLCLAFNETLTFPQRRVEIYQEALDALLKKWDSSRRIKRDEVYRKLSLGHKENMLARIAAETFEKNEYFIPQAELERYITDYVKNVPPHDTDEATDGEAILKAIAAQHGIFVERAREVYSFSHLTFQEYFTSKYIVTNAAKDTLTKLVTKYCADKRWREVFLLTTSLLPDATGFCKVFRENVDKLFIQDKVLTDWLTWAYRKSTLIHTDRLKARRFYLYLSGYLASRNLVRYRFSYFLNSYTKQLAQDSVSYALDYYLISALYAASELIRANTETDHISLPHDLALEISTERQNALICAGKLHLVKLEQDIAIVPRPTERASRKEAAQFAEKWRGLMLEHRDVGHDWRLTGEQAERLMNYLSACELLKDCLELATMPPDEKHEMLNNLYLPPAQAGVRAWAELEG